MVNNLINDLLDLSKVENKHFKVEAEYFNLSLLLHEVMQMVSRSALSQKIELRAEIDHTHNIEIIKAIYGDKQRYL